jgi:2-methylcitrate dehydratase PrpD
MGKSLASQSSKQNLQFDPVLKAVCEMSASTTITAGSDLVRRLTDTSSVDAGPVALSRLEVLLTDYLVCLASTHGSVGRKTSRLGLDGVVGLGAWLALQSSSEDRDDIDWSVGTHPGSVIWSSVFAMAKSGKEVRENFLSAALGGYRTSASVANFLGRSHREKWHVTATAGAFASTSAAALGLGLSAEEHQRALHLVGMNMGGSARAPRERSGAAGFNRAAATSLGLTAAMAAQEGAKAVENLWNGPQGVLELFSGQGNEGKTNLIQNGVSTSSLRLFPTNGYIQAAVLAVAELASRNSKRLQSMEVKVAASIVPMIDGSRGGSWWDARSALAAAWVSQDPSSLIPAPELEERITVVPSQVAVGGAQVIVKTTEGRDEVDVLSPPGANFDLPEEKAWREVKWRKMAGGDLNLVKEMSQALIENGDNPRAWDELIAMVKV